MRPSIRRLEHSVTVNYLDGPMFHLMWGARHGGWHIGRIALHVFIVLTPLFTFSIVWGSR